MRPAVYSKECFEIGSAMATRYIKSEMSLVRALIPLSAVLAVLGSMTVSDFSFTLSQVLLVFFLFFCSFFLSFFLEL
jgi:hypothetical protein